MLPLLLVGVVVVALFGKTATYHFVNWDDGSLITQNSHVNPPHFANVPEAWRGAHDGMYIPVTYNLWTALAAVGRTIGGPNAELGLPSWPYHTANVAVHLANTLLVLWILLQCGFPRWPATFGAIVFAIHPLQVEPVCWSVGMKDLLSGFFACAGIACSLRSARLLHGNERLRGHLYYSTALLCFFVGTLAKPGIIGTPLIAAVLDYAFVSRNIRAAAVRCAGLLLATAPSILWTSLAQPVHYDAGVSIWHRPLIACHALAFYMVKTLIPSRLCTDYGLRPLVVICSNTHVLMAMLVPLYLVGILLIRQHRKVPLAMGAIFVAGVLPVLGLVPFGFQQYSTVADRYVYLSMIGVGLGAAYLSTLVEPRRAAILGVVIAGGLFAVSWRQSQVWQSTLSLMSHTIRINPAPGAAYNNLALAIQPPPDFAKYVREQGNSKAGPPPAMAASIAEELVDTADNFLILALATMPEQPGPLRNMVLLRGGHGQYAEALKFAEMAYRLAPSMGWNPSIVAEPYVMAWLYNQTGQTQKAIEWLALAIHVDPADNNAVLLLNNIAQAQVTAATQPTTCPAPATAPADCH